MLGHDGALIPTTANRKMKPKSPPDARSRVLSSAMAEVVGREAMLVVTGSGISISDCCARNGGAFVRSVETPTLNAVAVPMRRAKKRDCISDDLGFGTGSVGLGSVI